MIRVATEADAAAVHAIYAPVVTSTAISFELTPPSVDEMRARIARTLPRHPWLVLEHEGAVVGYAYAAPHRERLAYRWSVDVSVYVDERHRGAGIGRRLLQALLELLALQGYVNAYAGIALPNEASVRLHQALGFREIGILRNVGYKLGAWRDVAWLGRILRLHPDRPEPPRTLTEIEDRATALLDALTRAAAR